MNTDFERIRQLFEVIVEQPRAQWDALLDKDCGNNAELRQQVAQLLKAHAEGEGILDRDVAGGAPTGVFESVGERLGTVIGPYKLLQQIGEGGMGTVFLAEQTHPVQRKVALKVIKAGMDSRQIIARFEAERQALAMMDHPNIARVIDAGTVGQAFQPDSPFASQAGKPDLPIGRPYFVMELVKGVPITKYCDDHHLTPRERLELFIPVCHAVQHAHQKGIIHRDLKPSNVLIALYDDKPVPKVIDFGVAKATGQKLTEGTMCTQLGQLVGTLEYMSPEQAAFNALDVDTRSDIYSLGVLLYELLAGSTPLEKKRLHAAAFDEMLRIIREEEPPKPSTRLSELSRVGQGRAASAGPPSDHRTAGQDRAAGDGTRSVPATSSLASIAAQRNTEPAKLAKLVRGDLDWIVMKALEKDRARRYETAIGLAHDIENYLHDEPVQACPPSAVYRLSKFARRNKRGLATAALLGLIMVVALSAVAGTIGWAVRDRDARQASLEQEADLALNEAERLAGQGKYPEALSAAQRTEGLLAGGGGQDLRKRARELRQDLQMVLRLEEIRLLASESSNDGKDFAYLGATAAYAMAFRDYGIDVETLSTSETADLIRARSVRLELASALEHWALVSSGVAPTRVGPLLAIARAADPDEWRNQMRDALEHGKKRKALLIELAASDKVRALSPVSLDCLGTALATAGLIEPAVTLLRKAQERHPGDYWINFELALCLRRTTPPQLDEAVRYASVALALRPGSAFDHGNLGNALLRKGQLDEAIICYQRMIELAPKYAASHSALGNALREKGQLDEAIACCRKAIELDPKYATAHDNLGIALADKGQPDEAIACYQKAIKLDPKLVTPQNNLGNALRNKGQRDEAIACYQEAIKLDPKYATAHSNLGVVLSEKGQPDKAIAFLRKAIELDPKYAFAHTNLGNVLSDKGQLDEAIACYRKAIELDPKLAWAQSNLGVALGRTGQPDKAIACLRKAIELDPKFAEAHNNLGNALRGEGQLGEAIACHKRAIELDPKYAAPHYNLGNAFHQKGQLNEAIASFRKAIELEPKLATAHNNLGALLCDHKRDYDGAAVAFRKAIGLKPTFAEAHHNLGIALTKNGLHDKAIAALREAIRLKPDYAQAHYNLGKALIGSGQPDDAIIAYQTAIKLEPKFAWVHYHLGSALHAKGQHAKAIAAFRESIRLMPDSAEPHNDLAWLLATCPEAKLRDPAQAVALALKAVQLDPKNADYPNTLGVAHYRAGDWKAALEALEKSVKLRRGGDGFDWFFLAMTHWRLGNKAEARQWYDKAVVWMTKNQPQNLELLRFRAEADDLMKKQ